MRRVAIIATASGCGKTTFGRVLATRLGVPFVELDALNHQAGWTELSAHDLHRRLEPLVARDAWVVDGSYQSKLGHLVLERADGVRHRFPSRGTRAETVPIVPQPVTPLFMGYWWPEGLERATRAARRVDPRSVPNSLFAVDTSAQNWHRIALTGFGV